MAANKKTHTDALQVDESQVQFLLARRQAMAEELHGCTSRVEAQRMLAEIFAVDEATQMGLLKALARVRDEAAADVLLAVHELAPIKAVRKEARRALIQLAGAKVYPSWTPEPEPVAVGAVAVESAPRFWKGLVTEARENGEVQLMLCWEYGVEYTEARLFSFLLDFWHGGVKDFVSDTGTRRYIDNRVKELQQQTQMAGQETGDEEPLTYVDCTLAEGRRLLNDALDVNDWRKTAPHKDFRLALPLVQRLILRADEVGEDRGLTFISRATEPDMVAVNFAGAWSLGDYHLCYDLLTRTSPLLEGRSRAEWVALRRQWADEAHPARFEVYFFNERERSSQSGIWLPASVLATRGAAPKEIEFGWSLELAETPLSGTLAEMPLGTAVCKETGRHWFWTVFVLEQEQGAWRLARIQDEGAAVQALPLGELQKRIQENDEAVQTIAREHRPDEPESRQHLKELVQRTWQTLAFDDALLVRNPLDKERYEKAYGRAMSLHVLERALVYVQEQVRRFPLATDHLQTQQRLCTVQLALADRFEAAGLDERAERLAQASEAMLRGTLEAHDALSSLLLADLLMGQERGEEAERVLLEAREFTQARDARAQIEFNLTLIAVNTQRFADAQRCLERLAEIAPDYPSLWTMLGYVHREQGNVVEAEVAFKRSMDDDPTEERAYTELGALYLDRDDTDQARDVFSRGIRVLPRSAHLHALMALVYIKKNDLRRAHEYVLEAERLDPDLEVTQVIREMLQR